MRLNVFKQVLTVAFTTILMFFCSCLQFCIKGYKGNIKFDINKPDGISRKLLDSKLLNNFGWHPKIDLEEGLTKTYNVFKSLKK